MRMGRQGVRPRCHNGHIWQWTGILFLFIESLTDAAIALGMDSESARKVALQTALGASRLASLSDEDASTLRKNVTSPGGTTEQAIQSFEACDIRGIVAQATKAAARRSLELSKEFGV